PAFGVIPAVDVWPFDHEPAPGFGCGTRRVKDGVMEKELDTTTARAWEAIGGSSNLTAKVSYRGAGEVLPAVLPVRELARATVGVCSLAAAELSATRNDGPVPVVWVDEGAVATSFVSERHLLVDGRAPTPFAPLSGFWRAADGWVRTHANYPHHRARPRGAARANYPWSRFRRSVRPGRGSYRPPRSPQPGCGCWTSPGSSPARSPPEPWPCWARTCCAWTHRDFGKTPTPTSTPG